MATNNSGRPLMHLFMHIGKLLNDELRSRLGKEGIHFGQARILLALQDHGELSQGKLGRGLHIKPATVTNQVKKMDAAGLVKRRQDDNDDRVMNVSLTRKGKDAAEFAASVMASVEKTVCSTLSPGEMEAIRKPMEGVRDSLGGSHPTL